MTHATHARPISRRLTNVGTLGMAALASLLVSAAGAPQRAEASDATNAMVRVELVDHDAGTRTRSSKAVQWSQTAALQLELGGHAHTLSVTPHQAAGGVSVVVDRPRRLAWNETEVVSMGDGGPALDTRAWRV